MPTYDYRCAKCGHKMEAFQKITEDPLKHCPECKKETLQRIPSGGIGLSFKGSGFYATDYAVGKKSETEAPPSETKPAGGCCPCGKNQGSCGTTP